MKTPVICYGEGCGKLLRWIDTPTGGASSGLCPDCYKIEMQKVDDYFRRVEAPRQQEEPV